MKKLSPVRFQWLARRVLFLLPLLAAFAFSAQDKNDILYPGITLPQHNLARETMHEFFDLHFDKADSIAREMRKLEQSDGLLPLSFLLRFAMPAWRILNNEFDSRRQGDSLFSEIEPLHAECLSILHNRTFPDSTRPTRMFLEAGINGFNATLIIRSKPLTALNEGLRAFRTLDSLRIIAPQIKDLYFGLGIFQCSLANEPGIIGFALHLFGGLHVNYDSGLAYLRVCSQEAFYTRQGAKEYLIQFLSPFKENEAREKQSVFRLLEAEFPGNPYYVFQEIDEGMAFHRKDVFSNDFCSWVGNQIPSMDTSNSTAKLYANSVRWQCAVIDSTRFSSLRPHPFAPRSCLSFYPTFLSAARTKFLIDCGTCLAPNTASLAVRRYHHLRNQAYSILHKSQINPMLREYYLWHLEDGLQ